MLRVVPRRGFFRSISRLFPRRSLEIRLADIPNMNSEEIAELERKVLELEVAFLEHERQKRYIPESSYENAYKARTVVQGSLGWDKISIDKAEYLFQDVNPALNLEKIMIRWLDEITEASKIYKFPNSIVEATTECLLPIGVPDICLLPPDLDTEDIGPCQVVACGMLAPPSLATKGTNLCIVEYILSQQSKRQVFFSFVTDLQTIVFFKTTRMGFSFLHQECSMPMSTLRAQQHLRTFLTASTTSLGFSLPLWSGAIPATPQWLELCDTTCKLYSCDLNDEPSLIFEFGKSETKANVLMQFNKVAGISGLSRVSADGNCFLVTTPRGSPFRKSDRFTLDNLGAVLEALHKMHVQGMYHSQVTPRAIRRMGHKVILLLQPSIGQLGKPQRFQGTIQYASDRILSLLQNGEDVFEFQARDDLHSLVRTVFEFTFPCQDPHLSKGLQWLRDKWARDLSSDLFTSASTYADEVMYDKLYDCLSSVLPTQQQIDTSGILETE